MSQPRHTVRVHDWKYVTRTIDDIRSHIHPWEKYKVTKLRVKLRHLKAADVLTHSKTCRTKLWNIEWSSFSWPIVQMT